MRRLASWTALVLVTLFLATAAHARSRHLAPTAQKCGNSCKVTLPIQNHDGYDTVHAWAVPVSARGQVNRQNILQGPSGIPGAQYLGSQKLAPTRGSQSVLEGVINYTGGEFTAGQPMHIYTGYTTGAHPSAHIWGASDGPALNLP